MKRALLWILVTALLLSFTGCVPEDNATQTTPAAVAEAADIYREAALKAENLKDMALMISATETVFSGSEVYTQHTRQTLLYNDWGTDQMVAHQSETRSYGDYQISISTAFRDGSGYFNVAEGRFQCQMTARDYCEMYAPAVLLDPALYGQITSSAEGLTTVFSFSQPLSLENWAAPEGASLLNASGSATLDAENTLIESQYTVRYQHEGKVYTKNIIVGLNSAKPSITFPDTQQYMALELPEVPILMEQAVGYLMQAQSVTSTTTETITCEVFGDTRTQTTVLNMHCDDSDYGAHLDITTELENVSRLDKTTQQQSIRYADGKYTTTVNGEVSTQSGITQEQMRTYCQDYLLSTILMTKYIDSIQVTQDEKAYRISFTANEDMAKAMRDNACQTLYGDSAILDQLAASYATGQMSGYITINAETLLPTSSGITYTGTHEINGVSYQLIFETSQLYTIPSSSAYDAIYA